MGGDLKSNWEDDSYGWKFACAGTFGDDARKLEGLQENSLALVECKGESGTMIDNQYVLLMHWKVSESGDIG